MVATTAKPTLTSRVRVNADVLFQELQGESVLLDLKAGVYFGLERVGTRIWQLLAEHERLAEVAQTIANEFDVAADRCAADLLTLVEDLDRRGLVTVISPDYAVGEGSSTKSLAET